MQSIGWNMPICDSSFAKASCFFPPCEIARVASEICLSPSWLFQPRPRNPIRILYAANSRHIQCSSWIKPKYILETLHLCFFANCEANWWAFWALTLETLSQKWYTRLAKHLADMFRALASSRSQACCSHVSSQSPTSGFETLIFLVLGFSGVNGKECWGIPSDLGRAAAAEENALSNARSKKPPGPWRREEKSTCGKIGKKEDAHKHVNIEKLANVFFSSLRKVQSRSCGSRWFRRAPQNKLILKVALWQGLWFFNSNGKPGFPFNLNGFQQSRNLLIFLHGKFFLKRLPQTWIFFHCPEFSSQLPDLQRQRAAAMINAPSWSLESLASVRRFQGLQGITTGKPERKPKCKKTQHSQPFPNRMMAPARCGRSRKYEKGKGKGPGKLWHASTLKFSKLCHPA